jgi:hypothetical protein
MCREGYIERAENKYRQALADRLRMRPPRSPLHFELGQCYRRTNRATACGAAGVLAEGLPWLAYAARRAGRPTRIAFADVATRIIGDVAVVTGRNDIEGDGTCCGTPGKIPASSLPRAGCGGTDAASGKRSRPRSSRSPKCAESHGLWDSGPAAADTVVRQPSSGSPSTAELCY